MDKTKTLELQISLQPSNGMQRARRVRFGRPGATSVLQGAFDELAERLHVRFLGMASPTFHEMWLALESARVELSATGAISEVQSRHLKDCLARDLDHLAAVIARGSLRSIDELRRTGAARSHCGALGHLLEVLDAAGAGVYRTAGEPRASAARRAGELTCAGTLSCAQCEGSARSARSRLLGPCTECGGKDFFRWP